MNSNWQRVALVVLNRVQESIEKGEEIFYPGQEHFDFNEMKSKLLSESEAENKKWLERFFYDFEPDEEESDGATAMGVAYYDVGYYRSSLELNLSWIIWDGELAHVFLRKTQGYSTWEKERNRYVKDLEG